MSLKLPTPSVPDLARIEGSTVEEVSKFLINYYNTSGGVFNYVRSIKAIRQSYRGFHNLSQLISSCDSEKTGIGRKENKEVVRYASPLAFDRTLQVFDLPARKFAFGLRQAGFRIPFFFVENGIIKLYFIQPRKRAPLDPSQVGMIATIYKKYLLDTEFFGEKVDFEFVEASVPQGAEERSAYKISMAEINLWSDGALSDRLTLISQALDAIEKGEKVQPKKRQNKSQSIDMPLFD